MWQLFIDFKTVYDSINRDSLYRIITEFNFPIHLIQWATKYDVHRGNVIPSKDLQNPVITLEFCAKITFKLSKYDNR